MSKELKDSGIDWIGEIPSNWAIDKLSRLTNSYSGGTPSRNIKEYWENGNISWMSSGEVNKGIVYDTEEKITELGYQNSSAKIFPIETVVVALNGQGKTKGMSAILMIETTVNQSLVGFICNKNKLHYRYLDYCFKASYYYNRSVIAGGNKRDGIAAESLRQSKIPCPSISLQKKIADRIFERSLLIDTIIEKTQTTIDDYKRLKQCIITEAVTKGLDKNVEMKESGVVWIGQIPKHWEMKASGSIFSNSKDRAEISDEKLSSTQSHGVVPQSLFEEAEGRQVVSVNKNYELLKKVKKNTFVISLRSFQGGIEMSRYDGAISAAYTILIPSNEVNTEYFRFLFKSSAYIQAIQSTIIESVREGKSVSYSDFKTIKLPIFDYNEQAEIAMYLEKRTHEIDSLIAKKEHLISDLEAYKKSLIYEYVTGKKEVE